MSTPCSIFFSFFLFFFKFCCFKLQCIFVFFQHVFFFNTLFRHILRRNFSIFLKKNLFIENANLNFSIVHVLNHKVTFKATKTRVFFLFLLYSVNFKDTGIQVTVMIQFKHNKKFYTQPILSRRVIAKLQLFEE